MSSKSDDFSLRYGDFTICNMTAVRRLEFGKVKVYVTWPASPCYSAFLRKIALKSDNHAAAELWQIRFLKWRPSAILNNYMGPIMGSLKRPRRASYGSLTEIIALTCLVFWENHVFVYAFWRHTDRQTDGQNQCVKALSLAVASGALIMPYTFAEYGQSGRSRVKF